MYALRCNIARRHAGALTADAAAYAAGADDSDSDARVLAPPFSANNIIGGFLQRQDARTMRRWRACCNSCSFLECWYGTYSALHGLLVAAGCLRIVSLQDRLPHATEQYRHVCVDSRTYLGLKYLLQRYFSNVYIYDANAT